MTKAKKLKHRKFKSVIHKDVSITDKRYKTNLIYSASINTSTPWIIVTNGDPKRATIVIVLVVLNLFLRIKNLMDFI